MMTFKRILALALALIMCIPLFAACGGNADETDVAEDTVFFDNNKDLDPDGASDNALTLKGKFTVKGKYAQLLVEKLAALGVETGAEDSLNCIYVGSADADAVAKAKTLVEQRENNYSDFAIVFSNNGLALYGASEYSIELAVDCLINEYVSGGAICVPADIERIEQASTVSLTVGSANVKDSSVYASQDSCADIARTLAKKLSIVTGYVIPVADKLTDNCISIKADNTENEDSFSKTYSVKGSADRVTVTAATRASLSYAVGDFAYSLTDKAVLDESYSAENKFEMKHADAADTALFKYCGTWQATDPSDPTAMVSYWNAAYVEICFDGNAITPQFSQRTIFRVSIDGGEYSEEYMCDDKITFFVQGDGKHTIRIYNKNQDRHLYFSGVSVENSVELSRAEDKALYIQFVGDSISANTSSFSHRVGDVLGWDFSVTAVGGMALGSEQGFWRVNNGYDKSTATYAKDSMADLINKNFGKTNVAMEEAFFKLGHPTNKMSGAERTLYAEKYFTSVLDFDFATGYTPDVVFIFLGTNDELYSEADLNRFSAAYLRFVGKILETYGSDTKICVMQRVSNGKTDTNIEIPAYEVFRKTAKILIEKYPDNVHFIDRDVISTWNVEISSDLIHPTTAGYDTLTEKLAAYLVELYG